jgi:post-segregation antitoxin (ccd killing protein)
VAIAAALGQKQCDVGVARASQHGVERAAAQQRSDAWNVGRQEVAQEML